MTNLPDLYLMRGLLSVFRGIIEGQIESRRDASTSGGVSHRGAMTTHDDNPSALFAPYPAVPLTSQEVA